MTSQFSDMASSSKVFDVVLFLFSYWSRVHVNIITVSGVVAVFFYKRLTWNSEIRNTPVKILASIWRLARVRDAKFGTSVSNKMLLNAAMPG